MKLAINTKTKKTFAIKVILHIILDNWKGEDQKGRAYWKYQKGNFYNDDDQSSKYCKIDWGSGFQN